MERKTRIYAVPAEPKADGKYAKTYLVEAVSQPEARQHVTKKYVGDAELPNGKRIADLMTAGVKVEPAVVPA